jgi:TonB family protein
MALPPSDVELNLLTEWADPNSHSRTQKAAIASVVVHAVVILTIASLPASVYQSAPRQPVAVGHRVITPLIEPLTEMTQKAPNTGKVNKQFNAAEIEPKPEVRVPALLPTTTRKPVAARQAVIPSMPGPKPASAAPALPEPPKIDAATKEPPKTDLPQMPASPVPQIQAAEKPKIAFENLSAPPPPMSPGKSAIPMPGNAVADAIRQAGRPGAAGGLVVGDSGSVGPGGASLNLPPTPGSPASQLQLLSDPMGVDFKPYLIRVLASVKLHWLAVIPESVRYGRRGTVAIQFSIARDGNVPRLVIASASGTEALDRAAVAGISASQPFPPFPPDFKGDKIVLQFNFAYNAPK